MQRSLPLPERVTKADAGMPRNAQETLQEVYFFKGIFMFFWDLFLFFALATGKP